MPQYNSFGMSPIRRRTPIGLNVEAFADVVGKLDAKYQQMAQQQSAIDMALAQLPVNAAEDEWKYNLGNEIRNQIESVENPNDRYLTSIRAAGQLMSRPDVVGRIRAQAEYDNFVKQTQARKDLTEDDKAWALANNPYNYADVRDDKGNIIASVQNQANIIRAIIEVTAQNGGCGVFEWGGEYLGAWNSMFAGSGKPLASLAVYGVQ